jgi:hypothetical protein
MAMMRHHWVMSTHRPDICDNCGEVRGPDSNRRECVPHECKPSDLVALGNGFHRCMICGDKKFDE